MNSSARADDAPTDDHRAAWALDAGLAGFAVTTGALLVFAYSRGGALAPFAQVGRRIVRTGALPLWADATVGLTVHLGLSFMLGAVMALLMHAGRAPSRLRSALIVVLAWHFAGIVAPLNAVRADISAELPMLPRIGLAILLVAALAMAPRR